MKQLLFIIILFCSSFCFAQELEEEFLPIVVEDKEAFMSTKTGEYVYREHAKTNPEELRTTPSGVVYNDISTHQVVKGETLSSIAKKHKINLPQLKKDNKLKTNKLSLGQELKIINRVLVTSSSPVISYAGEERIIAKLRPGQSPSTIAPPPPDAAPVTVSAPEKTKNPNARKAVSRKSTYYKPMVVPTTTSSSDEKEEVKEEVSADQTEVAELEDETNAILEAQKQLEEAQRKLELAKQKAKQLQAEKLAKQKAQETKEIEALEKVEEVKSKATEVSTKKEEEAKAKYDAIQEKLEKVAPKSTEKEKTEDTAAIAKKEEETNVEETVEEAKEEVEGVDYHVIVKGDNLYNLSKTYKTTVKKLSELNDVKFNNLKIGQKLKLK